MSRILFTSDPHFGHTKILKYCSRPFVTVDEMDAELIRRWNAKVCEDDTVYVLGDFYLGRRDGLRALVPQLHGRKVLVRGNHDRHSRAAYLEAGFVEVRNGGLLLMLGEHDLWLQHHPPHDDLWRTVTVGGPHYCLHGHVHGRWARRGDLINVGVDVREFEPKTLEELLRDQ